MSLRGRKKKKAKAFHFSAMPAGGLVPTGVAKERAELYQGRVTLYVVIACIVAAVGGSIFGYDIGISGTFCLLIQNFVHRLRDFV